MQVSDGCALWSTSAQSCRQQGSGWDVISPWGVSYNILQSFCIIFVFFFFLLCIWTVCWIIFVASAVMWSAYLWQNQKRRVQSSDETDDDDNSHDNDLQSPIDKVDPFSFFIETIQGKLVSFFPFISSYFIILYLTCYHYAQLCKLQTLPGFRTWCTTWISTIKLLQMALLNMPSGGDQISRKKSWDKAATR